MEAETSTSPEQQAASYRADEDGALGFESTSLELLRCAQRSARAWMGRCHAIDGDDVAQECLLLYWRKFRGSAAPQRPELWVRSTVRNLCLRELQRLGARSALSRELPEDCESLSAAEPDPTRTVEALDTLDALYDAARRTLPAPLRHIAALRCDPSSSDDIRNHLCDQLGLMTDSDRRRALKKVDALLRTLSRQFDL